MSDDQGLVYQDELPKPLQHDNRIPKEKRNVGYHEDDLKTLLNYSNRAFKGDVAAVLPLSDSRGMIPGSTNMFGRIVMGKSFRGPEMDSMPLEDCVVSDFKRITSTKRKMRHEKEELTDEEKRAILEGETTIEEVVPSAKRVPNKRKNAKTKEASERSTQDIVMEHDEPVVPAVPVTTNDVEAAWTTPEGELVQSPAQGGDTGLSVFERITKDLPPPPDPVDRTPTVEAVIDTPWCEMPGKYLAVIVAEAAIILVANPDYTMYALKPSSQKLTIRTGQDSYDVVYYGISYEYEGNVHQVYVRKK